MTFSPACRSTPARLAPSAAVALALGDLPKEGRGTLITVAEGVGRDHVEPVPARLQLRRGERTGARGVGLAVVAAEEARARLTGAEGECGLAALGLRLRVRGDRGVGGRGVDGERVRGWGWIGIRARVGRLDRERVRSVRERQRGERAGAGLHGTAVEAAFEGARLLARIEGEGRRGVGGRPGRTGEDARFGWGAVVR